MLSRSERREEVRCLHQQGLSKREIARRVGVDHKTVVRDLSDRKFAARPHDPVRLPPEITARIGELLAPELDRLGRVEIESRTGVNARRLYELRTGKVRKVTFGIADDLVTRLWGPYLWHEDPVLSSWYSRRPSVPGVKLVLGVKLVESLREHSVPCNGCGGDPDMKTVGCRTCDSRMYRRRKINQRWAA